MREMDKLMNFTLCDVARRLLPVFNFHSQKKTQKIQSRMKCYDYVETIKCRNVSNVSSRFDVRLFSLSFHLSLALMDANSSTQARPTTADKMCFC